MSLNMLGRRVRGLTLWIASFAVVAISLAALLGVPSLGLILYKGRSGSGDIVAVDRANHGSAIVEAHIEGRSVSKMLPPHSWVVGQRVTIYYDPDEPDRLTAEPPGQQILSELSFCLAAAVLVASALTYRAAMVRKSSMGSAFYYDGRVVVTLLSAGVALGTVGTFLNRQLGGLPLISMMLGLCGACLLAWSALSSPRDVRWRQFLQYPLFRWGLLFIVVGNLLSAIIPKR